MMFYTMACCEADPLAVGYRIKSKNLDHKNCSSTIFTKTADYAAEKHKADGFVFISLYYWYSSTLL